MKKLLSLIVLLGMGIMMYAQGPGYQKTNINGHPRVNQVNKRIDHQEHRINREVKTGKITKSEAREDRQNLKAINQEKKTMRRNDNGHLTPADQKALNQQLNQNSRQIKK